VATAGYPPGVTTPDPEDAALAAGYLQRRLGADAPAVLAVPGLGGCRRWLKGRNIAGVVR
jgi:hypothetical protein